MQLAGSVRFASARLGTGERDFCGAECRKNSLGVHKWNSASVATYTSSPGRLRRCSSVYFFRSLCASFSDIRSSTPLDVPECRSRALSSPRSSRLLPDERWMARGDWFRIHIPLAGNGERVPGTRDQRPGLCLGYGKWIVDSRNHLPPGNVDCWQILV